MSGGAPPDGADSGTMPQEPPQGIRQITPKQFAEILEVHFGVMASGIIATNPMMPPPVVWAVIAEAMGNVLSAATRGPDLKETLDLRGRFGDIVNRAIRHRHPAIAMTMPAMPAQPPANLT